MVGVVNGVSTKYLNAPQNGWLEEDEFPFKAWLPGRCEPLTFRGVYMFPACVACLLERSWTFWCCCCLLHWPPLTVEQFSSSRIPAARSERLGVLGANTREVLRYFREFQVGQRCVLRTKKLILVFYPAGVLKWGWEDWLLLHKDSFDWGFMSKNPYYPTSIRDSCNIIWTLFKWMVSTKSHITH